MQMHVPSGYRPISPDLENALGAQLKAYLSSEHPCDAARAQELACAFVGIMRGHGATPERTIAALKRTLRQARCFSALHATDRDREYARLVYLCIEHYFGCEKHGARECTPIPVALLGAD